MRRTAKAALAMLLAGAGLAAALPLSAETTQTRSDTPASNHMMGGDMGSMMKMMGDMRTMADACQRMMGGTSHQSGKDTGSPHHNPPADTERQQ